MQCDSQVENEEQEEVESSSWENHDLEDEEDSEGDAAIEGESNTVTSQWSENSEVKESYSKENSGMLQTVYLS